MLSKANDNSLQPLGGLNGTLEPATLLYDIASDPDSVDHIEIDKYFIP